MSRKSRRKRKQLLVNSVLNQVAFSESESIPYHIFSKRNAIMESELPKLSMNRLEKMRDFLNRKPSFADSERDFKNILINSIMKVFWNVPEVTNVKILQKRLSLLTRLSNKDVSELYKIHDRMVKK